MSVADDDRVGHALVMDWGALSEEEIRAVEHLAPTDPVRLLARIEGAFRLRHQGGGRAERIAGEERTLAVQRGHQVAAARADLVFHYTVGEREDPEEMLERLHEAFEIFNEADDAWGLVRASDLLAFIYEGMGDYATVLQYTEVTLSVARRTGDRSFEANALSSMVGVLTAAEDFDGARAHLETAFELAEGLDSLRLRTRLGIRLGRLERSLGRMDQSLKALEVALQRANDDSASYWGYQVLGEMAETHAQMKRFEEAEAIYLKSLKTMEGEIRSIMGPPQLVGLAHLRLATDRPKEALLPLEELIVLGRRYDLVPSLADGTKLLAEAFRRQGDFERAFSALSEHLQYRERMMSGEAQRAVRRHQIKAHLAAAQKDAEIHRLRYVELADMQTQLLESERRATIGKLTAGLSHEMNTPLGVVKSSLDTQRRALEKLQASLPEEPSRPIRSSATALHEATRTAAIATERLKTLIDRLRLFARLDEAEHQTFNLVEGLEATIDVLSTKLPEGIRIERRIHPVPRVTGWPSALNQAFFNVLENAVTALGGSGCIRVETKATAEGEVQVSISDDGPGVPRHLRERLFELELTREGQRAHLRAGLAMVKSILQRHQGRVELDPAAPQGATFHLYLPAENDLTSGPVVR